MSETAAEINYNYLDLLNPQQRAAVEYKDGPALVIAGAGSGKTRVLTYKIVDLLTYGYEPWRILALTFTNKAAREMKERISDVVGEKVAQKIWMGTFHSIFLRILRLHADKIGMKSGFTVYDASDSRSLIKAIIKDLNLDDKKYKPVTVASTISNAKNALISPEDYAADWSLTSEDKRAGRPMVKDIYRIYRQRCRTSNAMDFDDILMYMNVLLRDHPDVLRHYQEYFRYILVDEYQDTNFAQHLVISQLAKVSGKVCVVGDDAQSIYSFRGANIKNILNLERQFPGLRIFKLERNYRSTQNIINAAGSLIDKNTGQLKKKVYSENQVGEPVHIIRTYSDLEEAGLVASRISQSKLVMHDSYNDYAILYRTNAQSRTIEEALRNRNIPYRIYGGLAFYQRKEVKDAIAYFRLAINPDDDEALRRIINYPARGIGDTTLKKLVSAALENNVSILQVIKNLEEYKVAVNKGMAGKLIRFADMIDDFNKYSTTNNALETAQYIYNKTGILSILEHDTTPEVITRQENLTELLAGIKEYVDSKELSGETDTDLVSFLSGVFLSTDQDEEPQDEEPQVTLMTVHASKGLEFKHITIVGVEEELFPSAMSMDSIDDIEEERRLLYVAITRAKETCTITCAGSRFRNGQTIYTRPSRFLSELDRDFIKIQASDTIGFNSGYINPRKKSYSTFNSRSTSVSGNSSASLNKISRGFSSESSSTHAPQSINGVVFSLRRLEELKIGMKIAHQVFGEGEILDLMDDNSGVVVADFKNVGTKKLMLRFAKLAIFE